MTAPGSLTKAIEVEVSIDAPQQMIGRDMVIDAKVVKQPSLGRLNPIIAASPESDKTANHGPDFTSIVR